MGTVNNINRHFTISHQNKDAFYISLHTRCNVNYCIHFDASVQNHGKKWISFSPLPQKHPVSFDKGMKKRDMYAIVDLDSNDSHEISKLMKWQELQQYTISAFHGLSPAIICVQNSPDNYFLVTMERWPLVLAESKDRSKAKQQIWDTLATLRKMGIYYIDLHEENIVIKNDQIGIIDFEGSIMIPPNQSLSLHQLQRLAEFCRTADDCDVQTLDEYLVHLKNEIDFICDC